MNAGLNGWYPVARVRDLRTGPRRIVVNGLPLVIWQAGPETAGVAVDRCPHRGAPLSAGSVEAGRVACPYHGWQFGADGRCEVMPALVGTPPAAAVRAFPAVVRGGLVLAGFGTHADRPDLPTLTDGPFSSLVVADLMPATVAEVAENILDTTHTSVVHSGYLRRVGKRREVRARVQTGPDWIEARYPPEASPSGFVSRLIGLGPYEITDRFKAPSIAEVDYRLKGRLAFRSRFALVPKSGTETHVFAELSVRGRGVAAWLKLAALRRMMARIVEQDREILGAVSGNLCAGEARFAPLIAPQDLMRRGIEAILRGETPTPPEVVPDLWV